MPDEKQVDENAVAAGWDPADGDPPFEHGEFVDGLAAGTSIDDLIAQGAIEPEDETK